MKLEAVAGMKRLMMALLAVLLATTWLAGCADDAFVADSPKARLTFSADTVAFDTVFTTMGSTTRRLTVYNPSGENLLLSAVTLVQGRASRFRLNVDGDTSMVARNVEIAAGDSIFIFIQACINPNLSSEPFVVEDHIVFSNGQRLPLSAWGRNAVYHKAPEGSWVHIIDCDAWDHTLPHIIIDTAAVNSNTTLTLMAGEELYFAHNGMLLVWDSATLRVQGRADAPVRFTSLRHDGRYDTLPGQWVGVWLYAGSRNSVVSHAVVENATFGIIADSNVTAQPTLTLQNSVVRNMSYTGLWGRGSRIEASNCLFCRCGTAAFWAYFGGRYDMRGCTFACYWPYEVRKNAGVQVDNWYMSADGAVGARDLEMASFTDCIIWGTRADGELETSAADGAAFHCQVVHSIVRGGEWDDDPLFEQPQANNYRLRDGSPAEGIGYQYDE